MGQHSGLESTHSPAEHQATPTKHLGLGSQQSSNELGLPETISEDNPNAERRKRLKLLLYVAPREGGTEELNLALSTGCNAYSSGKATNHEDVTVSLRKSMLLWISKLHQDPSYEEVELTIEEKLDDESSGGRNGKKGGEEDAVIDMTSVST